MEEVDDIVSYFKRIGWANQRSWGSDFFAKFAMPKWNSGSSKLMDAAWTNILYYRTNYFFLGVVIALWAVYVCALAARRSTSSVLTRAFTCPCRFNRPIFLLAILLIVAGWTYVFVVRRFPIEVQGKILSRQEKAGACAAGSVVVLWLFGCLWAAIWTAGFTSLVVLAHALFRPANRKAKATQMATDAKLRVSSAFGRGGDDVEAADSSDGEGEEAGAIGRGALPGQVENRARRREDYAKRREQLQQQYHRRPGGSSARR